MRSNKALWYLQFVTLVTLMFVTRPLKAGDTRDSEVFSPEADDVLHMQISRLAGINSSIEEDYKIFLMNTNPAPSLPFTTGRAGKTFFASPPLTSAFTFNNITLTICHAAEPLAYAEAGIGWWDTSGNAHFHLNITAPLTPNMSWSNMTFNTTLALQQGERLLLWVRTTIDGTINTWFYFGDSDHDSTAQYTGTASYIPEYTQLPTLLLFLLVVLMCATLKKHHQNPLKSPTSAPGSPLQIRICPDRHDLSGTNNPRISRG
jgi:hypothetical protein